VIGFALRRSHFYTLRNEILQSSSGLWAVGPRCRPRAGQDDQAITGYVSRAVSTSDFDVTAYVSCAPRRLTRSKAARKPAKGAKVNVVPCPGDAPWVGEGMGFITPA